MVETAHRHGATVLVDGAQAVSHMPVDVQAIGCDFYVFSGHKIFGPTGIGALIGLNLNFGILRANPIIGSLAVLAIVYGMFFAIDRSSAASIEPESMKPGETAFTVIRCLASAFDSVRTRPRTPTFAR